MSSLQIASAAPAPSGIDTIVAIVNEGAITSSQLNEQVRTATKQMQAAHAPLPPPDVLRRKVLDHLIDNELELQAGKKAGVEVDDASVDQAIGRIAEQNHISVGEMQKNCAKKE